MGLLDYYRQFDDIDEEELNRERRERRARERSLALEQVPTLDLSMTEWPDLPNSEIVNASIAAARGRVNSYPDRHATAVRELLARRHEIEPEQIVVGNGIAELLQSVTLALLVLHGQRPTLRALADRIARELLTGALLGGACGLIMAVVALAWLGQAGVALALLAGISVGIAGSAAFGLAMPYLLRLLKRDPQVAAGPIALVFADVLALTTYFSVARWLLG